MTKPKVFLPILIPISKLHRDPTNTNKQDKATFEDLKENITEQGVDECLLVVPMEDRPGEFIVKAGNHRLEAAKATGYDELPCVVRDDWDTKTAATQSVRRNLSRGDVDKKAFTALVNELHAEHNLDFSEIQSAMGFHDSDEFASLFEAEKRQQEKVDRVINEDLPKIRALDDIVAMVQHILEENGDQLLLSFMLVPTGGRTHLYVASTNALKQVLTKVVGRCKEINLDVATALTGLLHIGINNANFFTESKVKEMDQLEKELTVDSEDTDLDILRHEIS